MSSQPYTAIDRLFIGLIALFGVGMITLVFGAAALLWKEVLK